MERTEELQEVLAYPQRTTPSTPMPYTGMNIAREVVFVVLNMFTHI